MARYRILAATLLLFSFLCALAQQPTISFNFTIPSGNSDTRTSAAVLDPNGILVRTLWANKMYPPGTYSGVWDGKLDVQAVSTPGQPYTIKLMQNQVTYTYDGHIFTTDDEWYSTRKWSWYCGWTVGIPHITIVNTQAWVGCGYNEKTYNALTFNVSKPNTPNIPNEYMEGNHEEDDNDTDGTRIYWMAVMNSTIPASLNGNFVFMTDANTGMLMNFSSVPAPQYPVWNTASTSAFGTQWAAYTDWVPGLGTGNAQINDAFAKKGTGIAVQTGGNILAVAHGSLATPVIRFFDKITGLQLGSDFTGLSALGYVHTPMTFTSEGLWVVTTDGKLNLITGLPNTPVVSNPISGLSYAMAVGANKATNNLFVADGGTIQQVIEFAPNTHAIMRRIGDLGSYNDCNPTVTHTRLLLDDYPITGKFGSDNVMLVSGGLNYNSWYYYHEWVVVDNNDNVWLQDQRGLRIQHFDANSNYVNQVITKHPSYYLTVSRTMPTRVFNSSFQEFTIDYTKPLVPGDPDPAVGGNGAWVQSKNWLVCAVGAHGSNLFRTDMYTPQAVERLSNGRVYVQVLAHYTYPGETYGGGQIWELPDNPVQARNTGVKITNPPMPAGVMITNGDISSMSYTGNGPTRQSVLTKQLLQGFDGSNNPIYSAPTAITSASVDSTNQLIYNLAYGGYSWAVEPSTGGYYPVYRGQQFNAFYSVGSPYYKNTSPTPKFGTYYLDGATLSDTSYMQFFTLGSMGNNAQSDRSWTLECWVETTSTGTQTAMGYRTSTGGAVWLGSSGGFFAFGVDGNGGNFNGLTQVSAINISDGTWHHIVMEMTDTNNVMGIQTVTTFVDGVTVNSLTGNVNPAGFYPVGYIGKNPSTLGMSWQGGIDEAAIFAYPKYPASGFTPPTAAYAGTETGLTLVNHFDGSITINNGNPAQANSRYPHAAAFKAGVGSYAWTAIPEFCTAYIPDQKGYYPCYSIGGYGGSLPSLTNGRTFLFNYQGNWTPWGAQFFHVYEDGMVIGQFGMDQGYPGGWAWTDPGGGIMSGNSISMVDYGVRPGSMGNIGWSTSVSINNGNDIYIYTGEEAVTAGHRWHIGNLSSIKEWSGSAVLAVGATATLTPISLTSSAPTPPEKKKHPLFQIHKKKEQREERKER